MAGKSRPMAELVARVDADTKDAQRGLHAVQENMRALREIADRAVAARESHGEAPEEAPEEGGHGCPCGGACGCGASESGPNKPDNKPDGPDDDA